MKGIILAGGQGTRLSPITNSYSKQLLPVFDKPLIYYPLSTLINLKIREILIIVNPDQLKNFKKLLGNGSQYGIKIKYAIQNKPNGIAESFIIGENFIKNDSVALILGDNIFYGQDLFKNISTFNNSKGAIIFLYHVNNPSQYGVADVKKNKVKLIIEKPKKVISNLAVTGLYVYDNKVVEYAKKLEPSKRGELEITDINNAYIKNDNLNYINLKDSSVWFDAGTPSSLLLASQYIQAIQERNNILVSSPEETSLKNNFIDKRMLKNILFSKPKNNYYEFLKNLLK